MPDWDSRPYPENTTSASRVQVCLARKQRHSHWILPTHAMRATPEDNGIGSLKIPASTHLSPRAVS